MTIIDIADRYARQAVTDLLTASTRDGGAAWVPLIRAQMLSFALEIVLPTPPQARHAVFRPRVAPDGGGKSKRARKPPDAKRKPSLRDF